MSTVSMDGANSMSSWVINVEQNSAMLIFVKTHYTVYQSLCVIC